MISIVVEMMNLEVTLVVAVGVAVMSPESPSVVVTTVSLMAKLCSNLPVAPNCLAEYRQ